MKILLLKTLKVITFAFEMISYVISAPIAIPIMVICEFFNSVNSYLDNKIKESEN